MPFGISAAPELYQYVMNEILAGLDGVIVYLDDVLVFGKDQQEHDMRLEKVLCRLSENGVRLNCGKCVFATESIDFLGHHLSGNGLKPQHDKINALVNFPVPENEKSLRSFLGLAEYAGHRFIKNYTALTSPLWDILKREHFEWQPEHDQQFTALKREFGKIQPLKFFQPNKSVFVRIDASGIGLGAILEQENQPILFASRKLTDTERRYSQLEREFLSLVFALFRFKNFVLGRKVVVLTDNKPMISFFKSAIDKLPIRIQRWILRLQMFQFELKHVSGHSNTNADCLSRAPLMVGGHEAESTDEHVCLVLENPPVTPKTIAEATQTDDILQAVKDAIVFGWHQNDSATKSFYPIRDCLTLSESGDMIFYQTRIVVPSSLRNEILTHAHAGHIGMSKMTDVLSQIFFWPKMNSDIQLHVQQCESCVKFSKQNKAAPMKPVAETVEKPWHTLGIDFTGGSVELKHKILFTVIDYNSRYPFAMPVNATTAQNAIQALRILFAQFGFPRVIISDNGPAFTSAEFSDFCAKAGVVHHFSAPYYPQSNGVVERFHGTLKHRLLKLLNDDVSFERALLQCLYDIRSSVNESIGASPFARLFGREMPTRWQTLQPPIYRKQPRQTAQRYAKTDARRKAKIVEFKPGDAVMIACGTRSTFNKRCQILSAAGYGSWRVLHADGRKQIVNQRFIRRAPTICSDTADATLNDVITHALPASGDDVNTDIPEHTPVPTVRRYALRHQHVDPKHYKH